MKPDVIHVLIVEDKALVAEDIAAKLRRHSLNIAGMFSSGEEAIEFLGQGSADLVLMDIQLAGKLDGIQTASIIRKSFEIPVVYLSDFDDHGTLDRAKKTLPENYLTKPIQEGALVRAIELAFYTYNNRPSSAAQKTPDAVFLRTDSQAFVKIPLEDILYLEADRAYCKVVCKEKSFTMSTSMNHIYEQINSPDFIKVHRSFIININNIRSLEGNVVHMDSSAITMSREGKDALVARLRFIK